MTGEQPATYLERSIALLWGTGPRPARGPRPGLTLEKIVDAAITIADTDGIDALAMRRVAAELGVGTMSLYRYVPGKAELLDLMLDTVSEPGPEVARAGGHGWRAALQDIARGTCRCYLAHPWLLQVNWSRPVFGPNTLAGLERYFASTDGLGLTGRERVGVLMLIDGFVTGFVRQQIQYTSAAEETGVSDEEFWAQQLPVLERALATGDYPAMAGLAEDAFGDGWEETFEFGLQRLLDGLEVLVAARLRRTSHSGVSDPGRTVDQAEPEEETVR